MWARIRVPTAAVAALTVGFGVLAAATAAFPGIARRLSLSPAVLVAMTAALVWITFLALLRDSARSDGRQEDDE